MTAPTGPGGGPSGERRAEPRRLSDRVWLLGTYHYNLYLVRGSRGSALVEVGISALVDEVLRQIETLGTPPDHLVLTHPHADHATGLAGLREAFPSALVHVGRGAPDFLRHPKGAEALASEDRYMTEVARNHGLAPARAPLSAAPDVEGCREVADGEELDLGGVTLRFLEARGHCPGHVAVHAPELRALFASDAVGFRFPGRGVAPLFFTGFSPYLETLNRLEALSPELLGLGHQGPVVGEEAAALFPEARAAARDFLEAVRAWGGAPDELAEAKFAEVYRDELRINSEENVLNCVRLLVRRSLEALAGGA